MNEITIKYEPTPNDWPEDFPDENGFYLNKCGECGIIFHGHKRRVRCKRCN